MAWKIVFHGREPDNWQVGDMWYDEGWRHTHDLLSQHYLDCVQDQRPPLVVVLPPCDLFILDRAFSTSPTKQGWQISLRSELVVGETPQLTLTPSINCVGVYHGYIRDGIITDDCEGRRYHDLVARRPVS